MTNVLHDQPGAGTTDLINFNFNAIYAARTSVTKVENSPTTVLGIVYRSSLRIDHPGLESPLIIYGDGFTFDAAGNLTGGTVKAFAVGGTPGDPKFIVSSFEVAAVEFQAMMSSATTADDMAFFATILSGADLYRGGTDGTHLVRGFAGNDALEGGAGNDLFYGDSGTDWLKTLGGNDTLYGGRGGDRLEADDGDDFVHGGDGMDNIDGGRGNDTLIGGAGNDEIFGDFGNDRLFGGTGRDYLVGYWGDDTIFGGAGKDYIEGDVDDDLIWGGGQDDYVDGGSGDDTIYGGGGNDTIQGLDGNDLLYGGAGNDTITGYEGNDVIYGGAGDDSLRGAYDSAVYSPGNFVINGGDGNDHIQGGDWLNLLQGGRGNDTIVGGSGRDTIIGYDGDDVLDGAGGDDVLRGGAGSDTFIFRMDLGRDTVKDLDLDEDVFQMEAGMLYGMSVAEFLRERASVVDGNVVLDVEFKYPGMPILPSLATITLEGISDLDLLLDKIVII